MTTDSISERITITSYAGNAWVRYTPDSDAAVFFSAQWGDIVRGEEAPITTAPHAFHEITSVNPVASDRQSLAAHISVDQLPLIVTLDMTLLRPQRSALAGALASQVLSCHHGQHRH